MTTIPRNDLKPVHQQIKAWWKINAQFSRVAKPG
jgi:hypothetical protein